MLYKKPKSNVSNCYGRNQKVMFILFSMLYKKPKSNVITLLYVVEETKK